MGKFDAELARMAHIASDYATLLQEAKQRTPPSTHALREFIATVDSHEKQLETIAGHAHDRVNYVHGVEQGIDTLEGLLERVPTIGEEEAAHVLERHTWGTLLKYGAFDKSHPAKPQLLKAIQDGIATEVHRGHFLVDQQQKSLDEFARAAHDHIEHCKRAEAGMAGAAFH